MPMVTRVAAGHAGPGWADMPWRLVDPEAVRRCSGLVDDVIIVPAPRLNSMTTAVAHRVAQITRKPANCALCRRRIDWSGADHHRAPGSLEDDIALCRDCTYHVEHGEAA